MTLHTVSIWMGTKAGKVNRMASKVITGQRRRLNQNERLLLVFIYFFQPFCPMFCSLINDPISRCQNFVIKWQWDYDIKFRSGDKKKGINSQMFLSLSSVRMIQRVILHERCFVYGSNLTFLFRMPSFFCIALSVFTTVDLKFVPSSCRIVTC